MDELEFRRRLFSDPSATDPALQQSVKNDSTKAELRQELLKLDETLQQALHIAVPDDLQARLLLQQQVTKFRQQRQRKQWLYGIAATVALALGLVQLRFEPLHFAQDLGSYALAHVYHEASALLNHNAQMPLAEVNQLMASFAGRLEGFDGKVRYARFCHFRGVRSLHLILDSKEGTVTVFVLPKDHGWQNTGAFTDDNFHGQSLALAGADLVLVAARQQLLAPLVDRVQQQFSFTLKQQS